MVKLVEPAPTVPGAPVLTATANGETQIDLSWTVPDTGGRALDKYSIDVSTNGGTTWGPQADVGGTITTYSHTGLTAGTTRHYRVAAVNPIGTGAWSNVANATTDTPGARTPPRRATLLSQARSRRRWGSPCHASVGNINGRGRHDQHRHPATSGSGWTARPRPTSRARPPTPTRRWRVTWASSSRCGLSFTDDLGNPESRTSPATLAVQAAAGANNTPEFTDGTSTTRSVAENTASSQNIGTAIAATDADSGDTLRYTLGGTDMASFAIVSTSGQLQTRAALDFETKSSYAVTVSVSDGNGGTDSIGVTITVTDVNEQPGRPAAPSVGATANSDTSLDVSWTAPGLNGGPAITGYDLQYRQGTSGSFTNGPQNVSGTSTMIAGLTAGTSYQVQVRALNGETPSDWSPSGTGSTSSPPGQPTLTLDVPNRFGEAAGSVQICVVPSAPSSQRITVQVATADGTATAPGDYVSHSDTVALQPQQQRACFTLTLVDDAAVEGDETFTVTLSNPVNATLGTPAVATFTIVDNDGGANVAPTFTEGTSTTRSVAENTRAGTNIGTRIAATDADSGDTLEYTLGGTDFKSFRIHLNTGQLLTQAALDYETKSSYAVTVSVSDGNGGTDSINVTINVIDVDESDTTGDGEGDGATTPAPRLTEPSAPRNLTKMVGDGQVVLTWRAPSSSGGASITDYEYRHRTSGSYGAWISTGSTETTHTVTGLVNGTAYTFQVRAVNRRGGGRTSNRAEVTPGGVLGFAHFANGDGITSDLLFVNAGSVPVRPALYFYDTEGALVSAESVVDVTGDLAVAGGRQP